MNPKYYDKNGHDIKVGDKVFCKINVRTFLGTVLRFTGERFLAHDSNYQFDVKITTIRWEDTFSFTSNEIEYAKEEDVILWKLEN